MKYVGLRSFPTRRLRHCFYPNSNRLALALLLRKRLKNGVEDKLLEYQSVFRPERSVQDLIHTLRQLSETNIDMLTLLILRVPPSAPTLSGVAATKMTQMECSISNPSKIHNFQDI